MIYSFVPFHEIAAEYIPQTPRWYEEILEKVDDYALNVDWEYYIRLSLAGYCFAALIRDEDDNSIQGHAVYVVSDNPRHKHIISASSDAVFIEEEHRASKAVPLLKFAHNSLQVMGVKEINYVWSDKRLGELLEKLEFSPTHTVWCKKLGDNNGQ